jgi:hypothetical protein
MKRGCVVGYIACIALLTGQLLSPLSVSAFAQAKPEKAAEPDLKVAYTIAFLKFLTHPKGDARPTAPIMHMCVIGDSGVAEAFARADGAILSPDQKKTLHVTSATDNLNDRGLKNCWAVYVEHSHRHLIADIARELRGTGVLLITESKGALNDGSMVNLLRVGDRLRWEMSRTSIEAEKLVMSSQVYRNAVKVE